MSGNKKIFDMGKNLIVSGSFPGGTISLGALGKTLHGKIEGIEYNPVYPKIANLQVYDEMVSVSFAPLSATVAQKANTADFLERLNFDPLRMQTIEGEPVNPFAGRPPLVLRD